GRRTSTLHISFLRERSRNSSPQESRIDLQWGSFDNAICVYLRADDTLMLQYRNRGVPTDVATLDASDVNASEAFTVIVELSGVATIYGSNGATATGYSPMTDVMGNQDLDERSEERRVGKECRRVMWLKR